MAATQDVVVRFPGGLRVEAEVGGHTLLTDQPHDVGGEDVGPSPYALFLASVATCAGFFIVRFCRARDLDPSRIRLVQRVEKDPETKELRALEVQVELPPDFPEKYVQALLRSADQCSVKKAIAAQPQIVVRRAESALPA